jgi:hypothetical protein
MEGAAVAVALLTAVAALVVSIVALAVAVRGDRGRLALPGMSARSGEVERRVSQLSRRLEAVEHQLDPRASRSGDGDSPAPRTSRTAGVALSHVGLVRFDAFGDTGGAQSFALALMDDDGDGVVLTSLHSRQTTRLFVKGVRRGAADLPLSAEEERAISNAGVVPGE